MEGQISSREYSDMVKKAFLLETMVEMWKTNPTKVREYLDKLAGIEPLKCEPERKRMLIITVE